MSQKQGAERRRTQRLPIVDSFSLFITFPKRAFLRLRIYDLSESGLQCDVVVEGEPSDLFKIDLNEETEVHLYLNQTLFLPLKIRVARVDQNGPTRKIGAEIIDIHSKSFASYTAFVKMLETLAEAAQFKV